MTKTAEKIVVALSGGVDSAVAALQLRRAGFQVEALHMTNWEDDDGYCTAARDFQDARRVCTELGISLHRVNFSREYRDRVFAHFLDEYRAGRTPNPDILCNREIKFGVFLEHAQRLGARRIATGHYVRLSHDGRTQLLKGLDPSKDQSYFLHAVGADALAKALFPLGELHKFEVRQMANTAGLPVHAKRDSTGICFIGERPFREFLSRYVSGAKGAMESPSGQILGEHQGLMYYTIGQRQGLGIGGQAGAEDGAWYVAGKDSARNVLEVVHGRDHPALWSSGLIASRPHWINAVPASIAAGKALALHAKIRYRQPEVGCNIRMIDADRLAVHFDQPQWAVAPGQSVVFYDGEVCLGGALIESPLNAQLPAAKTA